jgi:probable HAF family extracellular repeat protein
MPKGTGAALFVWTLILQLVLCLPARCLGQAYAITDLGAIIGGLYSEAQGINQSGAVVGDWELTNSPFLHAFYCHQGTATDPGTLGGLSAVAYAINDTNLIVGSSTLLGDFITHAFRWSNGSMSDLGTVAGNYSSAFGVNELGEIVGETSASVSNPNEVYAFVYTGGAMTSPAGLKPLGANYSSANGINSFHVMVGQTSIPPAGGVTNIHAFVYTNGVGVMRDLGTLGGGYSNARAINDAGIIVGEADAVDAGGATNTHAFVHTNGVGVMKDLVSSGASALGVTACSASSINNAGQIVGYALDAGNTSHAFLYELRGAATMLDLIDYIPPGSGWTNLVYANGINDAGQIAGAGFLANGNYHAFLLTPTNPSIVLSSPIMLPNGQFRLTVEGIPGQRFVMQSSTNLADGTSWVFLATNTLTGTSTNFTDQGAPGWPWHCYRALLLP